MVKLTMVEACVAGAACEEESLGDALGCATYLTSFHTSFISMDGGWCLKSDSKPSCSRVVSHPARPRAAANNISASASFAT